MAGQGQMRDDWTNVDGYFAERLLAHDPVLDGVLAANAREGLPAIDVSPLQGRFLGLLARIAGARAILEVGTLGGYSTICLARALPEDGRLVTLEADPHHARIARENIVGADLAVQVDLREGRALDTLPTLEGGEPFDLVFIDADKGSNPQYLDWAIRLGRPGTIIVCDNVVRAGRVLDADSSATDVIGTRALFDAIAAQPRLTATALQTVGAKGWDGLVMAVLD